MMRKTKRPNPIGIDLGASAIKARQLDAQGRPLASLVLPRREQGPEADTPELMRLASMLERHGFVGRRVVSACPWASVLSEPMRLPPPESGAPRDELAAAEMARLRQLQPGTFEVGYWPIPAPARSGEGSYVLASAAAHDHTDALVECFDQAGLDLIALDTPAAALARGVVSDPPARRGMKLLIDLGHSQARAVVLVHGSVVFERGNGEAGLVHLHAQIVEALELDAASAQLLLYRGGLSVGTCGGENDVAWRHALGEVRSLTLAHFEAAARELAMAINYIGHRYPDLPIESAVLTGGGALLPGVREYLASALGVSMGLPASDDPSGVNPALLALAQGLADHRPASGRAAA